MVKTHYTKDMSEAARQWVSFVGAPRCGTTSLAKYLRSHPQVTLSKPKESHFFTMRDLRGKPVDEVRRIVQTDYVDRFFSGRTDGSILADGSVSYLYAPERLEPALRLWPNAKFVICVRNPLQMVPSLHQRNFVNGDETVRDFARAWRLVPERRQGKSIPRSCLDPRLLDYQVAGLLGAHVKRFLEVVGPERCLISVFDDLKRNPGAEYRRLLDFLGLPDNGKRDFELHAGSRDCRIPWLQRLLQRPPRIALGMLDSDDLHNPRFAETAGPVLRRVIGIRSAILDWNEFPAHPAQPSTGILDEMRRFYRDDIEVLARILKRDLHHWLAPQNAPANMDGKQSETGIAA